jgi:FAD binding domain
VTTSGKRFTNEGNSYHDFVQAMVAACAGKDEVAAYLICDHETLRKYGLGAVAPFPLPLGHHLRTGYLLKGGTLRELANKTGINPAALEETVKNVNLHAPNPCVKPIENGPFYAIKVVVGDLGTYAGLTTDEHSRVLGSDRQPIAGLYAVGNDIASIMGGNYPGAGITLGPALTFGHIAGCHLAGAETGLGAEEAADADNNRNGPSVEKDGTVVMGEVA